MKLKLLAMLGAAVLVAIGPAPVSAHEDESEGHSYLALGDSVAFGFHPLPVSDRVNPANFIGYPEIVAQRLNIEDVNASCSGEATGGFIDSHGLDNSCRTYRAHWPLHVAYTGTQLAFATHYLKTHKRTRLVTLDLDANDGFTFLYGRNMDFPVSTCFTPDVVLYFNTCAVQNLKKIFDAIRDTGYEGLIVALTYYALDYNDRAGLGFTSLLNGAMVQAAAQSDDVLVASGFNAFQPASAAHGGSACKAGLLIPLSSGLCDVHPTPAGRDLLAEAIVRTIAGSCPAHSPIACLNRHRD